MNEKKESKANPEASSSLAKAHGGAGGGPSGASSAFFASAAKLPPRSISLKISGPTIKPFAEVSHNAHLRPDLILGALEEMLEEIEPSSPPSKMVAPCEKFQFSAHITLLRASSSAKKLSDSRIRGAAAAAKPKSDALLKASKESNLDDDLFFGPMEGIP